LRKKVVIIGSSFFYDDHLIDLIEESGGNIVADLTWLWRETDAWRFAFDHSAENSINIMNSQNMDDIFNFYAKRFENIRVSLHNAYEVAPLSEFADSIARVCKEAGTNAVINHIIKFCDLTGHHRQLIKDLLQKRGLQVLNLERDYSNKTIGQLKTRIEAFLEII